jgi:transcriptional regulator with XRE-family HTH domain
VSHSQSGRDSVEVKKRRLRTALRQSRIQVGLTQGSAAGSLYWSVSKIVRIEQGTVPVSPTDVRALLQLYGVTDEARVRELVELAQEARTSRGWSEFSDVLSSESLELFGNESAATVIYKYEPSVISGLLQTQEYARALLRVLGNSEYVVERRLEARMQRQHVLDTSDRPELNCILGEAALCRPIGGEDVMREQLAHLLALATLHGVSLYYLPLAAGGHRSMGVAFTVFQFDDPLLPDLLYLENEERETLSRDEEGEIRKYKTLYVELQAMAERYGSLQENVELIIRERYSAATEASDEPVHPT